MVSAFNSIYALCYIAYFVDIEPTIHTWDESNLVMVHDLKEFLDSIRKLFIYLFILRIVLSAGFITEISLWFFFLFLCPFLVLELQNEFIDSSSLPTLWNS